MYCKTDEWKFLLVRGVFADPNEYWNSVIFTGLLIANIYEANNEHWYVIDLINTGPFSNHVSGITIMCFALVQR